MRFLDITGSVNGVIDYTNVDGTLLLGITATLSGTLPASTLSGIGYDENLLITSGYDTINHVEASRFGNPWLFFSTSGETYPRFYERPPYGPYFYSYPPTVLSGFQITTIRTDDIL